jgi:uncharacterized protein
VTGARLMPPLPSREAAVDLVRALALLPVVAVNWVGYSALGAGGPMTPPQPAGSPWAQAVFIAVAALLAGKGLTLLAFLFGYSQGLSRRMRGAVAIGVRRRRMARLLLIGLLHGLFIYSGDILTLYAVCGFLMLGGSRLRLRQLRRRFVVLAAAQLLLMTGLSLWLVDLGPQPVSERAVTSGSWAVWLAGNAWDYFTGQLDVLLLGIFLPLSLMTAGLMAARLRLFSHPRWRRDLRRWARCWCVPGLVINIAWAFALWQAFRTGHVGQAQGLNAFASFVALPMLLGIVPAVVLAGQRGARWARLIAGVGRHTLSLYIGSSVVSLALFSSAGLAWPLGTVALAVAALLYWSAWMALAPRLQGRLPLEAWLSR